MHEDESLKNAEESFPPREDETYFDGRNLEQLENYLRQRLLSCAPSISNALQEHEIDASTIRVSDKEGAKDRQDSYQVRAIQIVEWQGQLSEKMREILLHADLSTHKSGESSFKAIGDQVEESIESLPRTGLDFLRSITGDLPDSVSVMPSTDPETIKAMFTEDPRYAAISVIDNIPHYRAQPDALHQNSATIMEESVRKAIIISDRIRGWSEEPGIQKVYVGYGRQNDWNIHSIRLKLDPIKCINEHFAHKNWSNRPPNLTLGSVPTDQENEYEKVIDDLIELRTYDNDFSPEIIENIQQEISGISEDHDQLFLQFIKEAKGRDVFIRVFALHN